MNWIWLEYEWVNLDLVRTIQPIEFDRFNKIHKLKFSFLSGELEAVYEINDTAYKALRIRLGESH